jgi:hypothetical protein
MNAIPPQFTPAVDAAGSTALRWAALLEAAALVAALAGREPERAEHDVPALICGAEAWRRDRAEAGVADLAAIMEPGLAALLAVNARGADPQPAALALWREFSAARAAILALLLPDPQAGA